MFGIISKVFPVIRWIMRSILMNTDKQFLKDQQDISRDMKAWWPTYQAEPDLIQGNPGMGYRPVKISCFPHTPTKLNALERLIWPRESLTSPCKCLAPFTFPTQEKQAHWLYTFIPQTGHGILVPFTLPWGAYSSLFGTLTPIVWLLGYQ